MYYLNCDMYFHTHTNTYVYFITFKVIHTLTVISGVIGDKTSYTFLHIFKTPIISLLYFCFTCIL